jgi:DNA repair protein RecN (Recombination protein N)
VLRSLHIRDFAVVERAQLDFARGFTALTGETGAGKSMLIDALAMVLGERSDVGLVRAGAERSEIGAEFTMAVRAPIERWLAENDLAGDAGACLIRRIIERSGRSRAFINGRPVTLAQLREAGGYLVDIHGQHEHQSLLQSGSQRALLDGYAGVSELAAAVAAAWRRWQDLRAQLSALETNAAVIAAEREQLEWQVNELSALNFNVDEWAALQAEHVRLAHAASLVDSSQFALEALAEGDHAGLEQTNAALARLRSALEYDGRLKETLDVLEPAQIQLQEAVYALRDYVQRLELDPQRLREVEQRLDAVHSAARKYRVVPDALADTLAQARQRLDDLSASGNADEVRQREAAARQAYLAEANKLSAARRKAAKKLSEQVTGAMQTLAMEGGTYQVALHPLDEGNSGGLEQVEFVVSAHRGLDLRPLAKAASGGELSRVSLAIQAATSQVARVPTLIFDEVDAGIGGRVAEIVGRMLKKLGRTHQVMCVTHLPQVAASADEQWQVAKTVAGGKVASQVAVLDATQRVEEIARMLGGIRITETTRRHAAEMLDLKEE